MILGITGSIGCGKSTVLELFASAAWRTADADSICRRMYDDPHGELAERCRSRWGEAFFTDGNFDRGKIAAVVFRDAEALRELTGFIYPALERELEAFIAEAKRAGGNAAVEIPLMYENGMDKLFDAVLTVWAPESIRHDRLRRFRGLDDGEIRRREALQLAADVKLERADYALINSGSKAELERQLHILLENIDRQERNQDHVRTK